MKRIDHLRKLRSKLASGGHSIGSWLQIPHPSVAEIMGQGGFDWVAVDMEHGSIGVHQLPDLFRSLELGETLPLVRLAEGRPKDCKQALDAGAAGVIVPMVESAKQLASIRDACRWPPAGTRGVGFSRANLFGQHFDAYREEAQFPLLVAMIETREGLKELDSILKVPGLDALLIGPYDLSASLGLIAQFEHPDFVCALGTILTKAKEAAVPVGIHVVEPSLDQLQQRIAEGYRFLAYSIDSVMLRRLTLVSPK